MNKGANFHVTIPRFLCGFKKFLGNYSDNDRAAKGEKERGGKGSCAT